MYRRLAECILHNFFFFFFLLFLKTIYDLLMYNIHILFWWIYHFLQDYPNKQTITPTDSYFTCKIRKILNIYFRYVVTMDVHVE